MQYFPADSYLKQSYTEHIGYWKYTSLKPWCYNTEWLAEKCFIRRRQTRLFIAEVSYHRMLRAHLWGHYGPCLLPTRLICMCQARKTHPVFKCSEKGWDTEITNERLIDVWEKINVSSYDKRNTGFRCFQGHLTQKVKTPTSNPNADLLLIPGGMTSLLHVLLM
jgi:hypothetical protein